MPTDQLWQPTGASGGGGGGGWFQAGAATHHAATSIDAEGSMAAAWKPCKFELPLVEAVRLAALVLPSAIRALRVLAHVSPCQEAQLLPAAGAVAAPMRRTLSGTDASWRRANIAASADASASCRVCIGLRGPKTAAGMLRISRVRRCWGNAATPSPAVGQRLRTTVMLPLHPDSFQAVNIS